MPRLQNRPHAVLVSIALFSAFFATGCRESEPANEASTPSEARPAAIADTSGPRHGGEFRLSLSGVASLDPAKSTSLSENLVLGQVFQGLVRFDPQLLVVPDLASEWSLSTDGTTYSFQLCPDARFHNGRKVTSADVRYSFERLLDRRLGSPARSYLVAALDGGVDAITTPAPDRVEIRLVERDHVFISFLAMQHVKIVPREAVESGGFGRRPVGSGPFRLTVWEGDRIELEAARLTEDGIPYLDRVVFRDLDRAEERRGLVEGTVDYLIVAPDERREIPELDAYRTRRASTLSLHFLGMNMARPPFDDARVREAIAHGIDRAKLERATRGRVRAARSLLPPGMPGHDPSVNAYPYDPERARRLIALAGYGADGKAFPAVELFLGRIPEQVDLSTEILADLREIGIDASVRITDDYQRFVRELRDTDLWVLGWGIDYPDPDNIFSNLFRSDAQYNFTSYVNPEIDALVRNARHGTGAGARLDRARLYRQAEQVVLRDYVIVPLFHDAAVHCVAASVRGIDVNALGIYYNRLDRVWIDAPELTSISTEPSAESR